MNKKVDYLIVGQGLAGTFLTFNLLMMGKSILVVDKGHTFSSSFVAAGLINPLVLKRLTKTWRAEEFLEYNRLFYQDLEIFLNNKYHFHLPVYKLISSEDEEAFWAHRFKKGDVSNFIEAGLTEINKDFQPTKPFKTGRVKYTSWLNISELLKDFRNKLKAEDKILEESFDFDLLSEMSYKQVKFKQLVFCEGAQATENPLFGDLPFSLNKGQLLTIGSENLPTDQIFKKKVFILPTKKNEYKVGATYSWKWDNSTYKKAHKVEKEKTTLLKSQLEEMTRAKYVIKEEKTGIRPSVKDRRPLIGKHRGLQNIYIFNGMGSRGCFMAPLLSKELIEHIEEDIPLHPEVELSRYF